MSKAEKVVVLLMYLERSTDVGNVAFISGHSSIKAGSLYDDCMWMLEISIWLIQ